MDNWHPGEPYTPTENITLHAFWATYGEYEAANAFRTKNATVLGYQLTDFEYNNGLQGNWALKANQILQVLYAYNNIQDFAVRELLYQEKDQLTKILNKTGVGSSLANGVGKPANAKTPIQIGSTLNPYNKPLPGNMDIGAVGWDSVTQSVRIPVTGSVPADNMGFLDDNGDPIVRTSGTGGNDWNAPGRVATNNIFFENFGANPWLDETKAADVTYTTLSGILPDKNVPYTIKQYNQSLELNKAPVPPAPDENIFDRGKPAPGVYKYKFYAGESTGGANNGVTAGGEFGENDFVVFIWKGAERKFATIYVTTYVAGTIISEVDDQSKVVAIKAYTVDWNGLTLGGN